MKTIIEFLNDLHTNNNRPWFEANKERYRAANERFMGLTAELIEAIGAFDPTVRGLTVKDCTYRIYRDTRFSTDKTPYKTHMGCYVCRGGKKSGFGGYYFHIEPGRDGLIGGNILSSGVYMPQPDELKSIREEILDHGDELLRNMAKTEKRGFALSDENKLKRVPTGFPADSPHAELLKLKDVYVVKTVGNDYVLGPDLAVRLADDFRSTIDFLNQLNRAVEYAHESRGNSDLTGGASRF